MINPRNLIIRQEINEMILTRKNWWEFAITFVAGCLVTLGIIGVLGINNSTPNISSPIKGSNSKVFVNEKNLKEFKSIKIAAPSNDINFVPSDCYGLEICEPNCVEEPKWSIENEQLEIQIHENNSSFRSSDSEKKYINIYYPKNSSFENILVDISNGDINIPGTKIKKLKINVISGDINATVSNCNDISVYNKSGDINIKNNSEIPIIVDTKTTSGNIKIKTDSKTLSMVTAETTSGNIEIYCDGNISDYSYNASAISGSIIVNDKQFDKRAESFNPNITNSIVAKAVCGNIRIDFKK